MKVDDITADLCCPDLDARIEALGHAWTQNGQADVTAFLPPESDPHFLQVLLELLRRDSSERRYRGLEFPFDEYRRRFAVLFEEPTRLQELSFEDYRERALNGELVSPEHYKNRLGVDVRHWPPRQAFTSFKGEAAGPRPDDSHSAKPEGLESAPTRASVRTRLSEGIALHTGDKVGDFQLIRELGHGAVGRVFLARQGELSDRQVVIKITYHGDDEPTTLAQMQHTNIVPIYSVHRVGTLQVVCMPYFGATTLSQIIAELTDYVRPMPPSTGRDFLRPLYQSRPSIARTDPVDSSMTQTVTPESADNLERLAGMSHIHAALWLCARIADGLAHAHERGILHCDLKPANVLLTNDGQPMLLDFNVAIQIGALGGALAARVGGTLPYMAPEHLEALRLGDREVDQSADLYSLGVILYELLTGVPPFPTHEGKGTELVEILRDQRRVPPVAPSRFNAAISPAVDAIVRKLLDPMPLRRYSRARDLSEDLERQLTDRPLLFAADRSLRERFAKWRRRNRQLATALAVLAATMLFLVFPASVVAIRQRQLLQQRKQLNALEARGLYEKTADEMRSAIAMLSSPASDREMVDLGLADAQAALAHFGVDRDPDWMAHDPYRLLSEDRQRSLRADFGEMLLLMSRRERHHGVPGDPNALIQALHWNRLAEQCFGEDLRPRSLLREQAELARLVGEAPPPIPQDGPPSEFDLYHEGVELAQRARYSEALQKLIPFTEFQSQHVHAWYVRGICHAAVGQLVDAVHAFTLCVSLAPDYPWAYFQRGLARIEQSQFSAADRDMTRVLEAKAKLPPALLRSARFNRAKAREALHHLSESEEDLTFIIDQNNAPTRALFLRARIRRAAGNKTGAEQDHALGLSQTPTDAYSWNARGFYRMRSDPAGALADFEEALKLNPRMREALQNKALVLADIQNRPMEAVAALDRLLEYHPNFLEARAGRGVYLARAGKREKAIHDAKDCLAQEQTPFLLYQIAGLYAQLYRHGSDESDRTEAMRLVALAFRRGFDQFSIIDSDPDIQPLVKDPMFEKLLAGAKSLVLPKP